MFGEITKDMLVSDHKHRGPRFWSCKTERWIHWANDP
jgi:hypothetical protein